MASRKFEWKPFSRKQRCIMNWWCENSPVRNYDGIIADGAVRSGKTVSMAPSFIHWAMTNFSGRDFALCGKTIGSLRRNVINTLKLQLMSDYYGYIVTEKRSESLIIVKHKECVNYFYLFGGRDESSQDLIQGMTLAGVFFDEVAIMPKSFVAQAEARCSVEGAKFWYNCNPRSPAHYFYKEYIKDRAYDRKNLLYLHFTMDDNLTLSEDTKKRYRRMFTGVFYQRNILGMWVTAEGRIYSSFSKDNIIDVHDWYRHDSNGRYCNSIRNNVVTATIGVDFGGSKSSTAFVLSLYTRNFMECIIAKELRIKDYIDPDQLNALFVDFVRNCKEEYPFLTVAYCDSAEQVLIRGLRKALAAAGISVAVKDARKGPILDRIRFGMSMFAQHRLFILSSCTETIEAYEDAVWDEKHDDVRLDDGTTNIDSLDAAEYSQEPYIKNMIDTTRRSK